MVLEVKNNKQVKLKNDTCRKNGEDTWLTLPAKGVETEAEKWTVIKFGLQNSFKSGHFPIQIFDNI